MSSRHPATVLTVKAIAVIEILHILGIFSGVISEQTPEWMKAIVENNHSLVILLVGVVLGFLLRSFGAQLWRKLFQQKRFAKFIISAIPDEILQHHAEQITMGNHKPTTHEKKQGGDEEPKE